MTDAVFAAGPDDLADSDTLLSMSGLEFMTAMLQGRLPHPPIGRITNYRLESVEEGRVVFRGTPGFDHLNPMGGVHGGWYGTVLDSCMACAVMTLLPQGSIYTTLEYKVNITGAIPPGTPVLAEGRVQHGGRSTAVAAGEIRDTDTGRLYATGSTTCLIMSGT